MTSFLLIGDRRRLLLSFLGRLWLASMRGGFGACGRSLLLYACGWSGSCSGSRDPDFGCSVRLEAEFKEIFMCAVDKVISVLALVHPSQSTLIHVLFDGFCRNGEIVVGDLGEE